MKEVKTKNKKKSENEKLTTMERIAVAELFCGDIEKKVIGSKILDDDEVFALKEVSRMVGKIAGGWKNAGQKRDKEPSREALYLRKNRTKKKLEQAKDAGMRKLFIRQLEQEFKDAEREYNEFMEKDNERTSRG